MLFPISESSPIFAVKHCLPKAKKARLLGKKVEAFIWPPDVTGKNTHAFI